jgi:hypothetical protein
MKTIHYGNSTAEQKEYIQSRIRSEVYCLENEMIEYILKTYDSNDVPFSWEDVENLYNEDDEPQEIFQWFLVSNWLADDLYGIGEPVIRRGFGQASIWGRTCCGQSIELDPTFWNIYQDYLQKIEE